MYWQDFYWVRKHGFKARLTMPSSSSSSRFNIDNSKRILHVLSVSWSGIPGSTKHLVIYLILPLSTRKHVNFLLPLSLKRKLFLWLIPSRYTKCIKTFTTACPEFLFQDFNTYVCISSPSFSFFLLGASSVVPKEEIYYLYLVFSLNE